MLQVNGSNISLTRGDTAEFDVLPKNADGTVYEFQTGDSVIFTLSKKWGGPVIVEREVPTSTLVLSIRPADTASLKFGQYCYDLKVHNDLTGDEWTFVIGSWNVTDEADPMGA